MPITIIINVNIVDSPVMIGLSTLIPCTGLTYNIVAGGNLMTGFDDFNMNVTSSQVIIDIYDISGNCIIPYEIYGTLYVEGDVCKYFNVHVTDECIIPPIPDVSYDCVSGVIINNYDGGYIYNIEPGDQLNAGEYILTAIDSGSGCYSAVNFSVVDCCPGYTVNASYVCIDSDINELTIIILDPTGGVADLNITNISLIQNTLGSSGCSLTGNGISGSFPNSPSGYTISNICSGYYELNLSISLDIGCILQSNVNIQCTCVDCTDNPFPTGCCSVEVTAASITMNKWCTTHDCGDNNPFIPNCGDDTNKNIQSWIIDTTNPLYSGLFSIQFLPSAVADLIKVYQDGILIAESPAVGFWNNTFCPTDDVLGFWTNEINNAGSISTPFIYNATGNPGVSGMNVWFPNYENDCNWIETQGCANLELGLKERRGAGELFFEITDTGTTATVTVEIWFNPNCTMCTQDCIPDCPFCDGLSQSPVSNYKYLSNSCSTGSSCPTGQSSSAPCSNALNSIYITQLPNYNLDNIANIANDNNGIGNGQSWPCSLNGTKKCTSPNDGFSGTNLDGGYIMGCDGANIGTRGPLTHSSGIRYKIRGYNNVTCDPNHCEISFKNFNTSCEEGLPQFSWIYSYEISDSADVFIIITVPINNILNNKKIKDSNGVYYNIQPSGNDYIVYLNTISDTLQFTGFYDSFGNQSIVPYGNYTFTTYSGINLNCYDTIDVAIICNCPSIDSIAPDTICLGESVSVNFTYNEGDCSIYDIIVDESTVPSGLIVNYLPDTSKIILIGTPTVTGSFNIIVNADCLDCSVSASFALNITTPDCGYNNNVINPGCGLNNGSITLNSFDPTCATGTIVWLDGGTGTTRTNLPAGTYTMYIDDINGCQVSGAFTLANVGAPTFNAPSRTIACTATGTTIALTGISGGTGPYDITVNYVSVGTGIAGPSFTTTGNYVAGIYNVVVTDSLGCSSSSNSVLTQIPNPTINYTSLGITCNNSQGNIRANFASSYNNFEVYYSPNAINCSTYAVSGILIYDTAVSAGSAIYNDGTFTSSVTLPINVTGTYYMCFYDTVNFCCTCSNALVVSGTTVPSDPTISNLTLCNNNIITVTGVGECVSGSIINYYTAPTANAIITNGQVISGTPHYLNSSNLVIGATGTYLPTGTYTYYSACTYGSCLSGFDSFDVIVTSAPTINITGAVGCANTYTVSATSGFTSYFWKKNGIIQAATGSTYISTYAGTIGNENNTTYTISVTGITANNCISTATGSVVIYPKPSLSVTAMTICSPASINLFTQPQYNVNGGMYTYYTATANGYLFEYFNGSVWTSVLASATVTVNTTQDYQIRVTNSYGCISSPINLHITVNGSPSITVIPYINCTGGTLTANSGFSIYSWNTGAATQSITVSANGIYSVTGTQGTCTAATAIVVNIPTTPTISMSGIYTCQNVPNVTGNMSIVGTYDYITVSSNNIAIVPNITIIGATTIGYNTQTIGTATVTAIAHFYGNTCTAQTTATVTIHNSTLIFSDICYGETLSNALISTNVPNQISILALENYNNCVPDGTYNNISCCTNFLNLGGNWYSPSVILEPNTYVAFSVYNDCCKTDTFKVYKFDVDVDTHQCNTNGVITDVNINHYVLPVIGSTTEYTFVFTETTTLTVYSWSVTNSSIGSTQTFAAPTPLLRGNYDYSVQVCYNYESETALHCCTVTGNVDIDCCDSGSWTCNTLNRYYLLPLGGIGSSIIHLHGVAGNTDFNTGTYYIYDNITATSTGDYIVSGSFVADADDYIDVSGLGLVSGTCYDMVFESPKLRGWCYYCYNGTTLSDFRSLAYNAWSAAYTTGKGKCILGILARELVCFEIAEFGVTGGNCIVTGPPYYYYYLNILIPQNYEFEVQIYECASVTACSTDVISNNNVINSTYPTTLRMKLNC